MQNLNRVNARFPVPVPAGTVAGEVVAVGAGGLRVLCQTAQHTQANEDDLNRTNDQGLEVGEASVAPLWGTLDVELAAGAAPTEGALAYCVPGTATYTEQAAGNVQAGYFVQNRTRPGTVWMVVLG